MFVVRRFDRDPSARPCCRVKAENDAHASWNRNVAVLLASTPVSQQIGNTSVISVDSRR